jgi:hypothetical protein
VLLLSQAIKAVRPEVLIVLGGPQATSTATATMTRFTTVDLVIRGEAEVGWAAFLAEVASGRRDWQRVPGSVWRAGAGVGEAALPPLCEDLDELPVPLFEAYPAIAQQSFAMVEVGRGCPYGCTFCSTNTFFKRRFRMKTPARILAEVDALHRAFGIRDFDFIHDMFTVRTDVVEAICDALRPRGYTWTCSARTDRLDRTLLARMVDAGCRGVYFGIETGSQRLQRALRKNLDVQEAVQMARTALAAGLEVTTSVIVGYPNETRADLRDSLLLLAELFAGAGVPRGPSHLTAQAHLFAPLADTPLTREGGPFAYDGIASNTVESEGDPSDEENALIRSSFALFSAFYHPVATEYARRDYLALTALLDELRVRPAILRHVCSHDRLGMVSFLLEGHFGVSVHGRSRREIARDVLACYAARHARGAAALDLFDYDEVYLDVQRAPVGTTGHAVVPADCGGGPRRCHLRMVRTPARVDVLPGPG